MKTLFMRGLDARSVKTFFLSPNPNRDNAINVCQPLFITQFFRGGETPQYKNQHTLQVVTMCKVLYISIIHNVVAIICC